MTADEYFLATVRSFGSVGVDDMGIFVRDQSGAYRKGILQRPYDRHIPIRDVARYFSRLASHANEYRQEVTLRAYSRSMNIIQLDDVDLATLQFFRRFSFLRIRTSEHSFQAWIAVPAVDQEADLILRRRIKRGNLDGLAAHGVEISDRTRERGTVADRGATESVRCPGVRNWKARHRESGSPMVLAHTVEGRTTTAAFLEELGILSPPEPALPPMEKPRGRAPSSLAASHGPALAPSGVRGDAPDYARCSRDSSTRHGADFTWAFFASQRNWSIGDIEHWLSVNSDRRNDVRWTQNPTAWHTECHNTAVNASRRAEAKKHEYLFSRPQARYL